MMIVSYIFFLLQGALLASLLLVVVTGLGQKRQRHKIKTSRTASKCHRRNFATIPLIF
jgi:hypothetical protein